MICDKCKKFWELCECDELQKPDGNAAWVVAGSMTNEELACAINAAWRCCSQGYVAGQNTRDSDAGKAMLAHLKKLLEIQGVRAALVTAHNAEVNGG